MTPDELQRLTPWFRSGERYLNGAVIDWTPISYRTMAWMKVLREYWGEPIRLIRGAHPNNPTAVDACCPTLSLGQLATGLMRIPDCSWGLYSGNSFHLDTLPFEILPRRWCAIRPAEMSEAQARGLAAMFSREQDGWRYCEALNSPQGFACLALVVDLAERQA